MGATILLNVIFRSSSLSFSDGQVHTSNIAAYHEITDRYISIQDFNINKFLYNVLMV